ncbi:hypothetical protein [Streptomyces sp. NPDC004589]|uniref:hypothetical protein n=1 Tax=Streptomyces sp. NPDC004589 TaxID=3154553 RepID=UPI0033BF3BAC
MRGEEPLERQALGGSRPDRDGDQDSAFPQLDGEALPVCHIHVQPGSAAQRSQLHAVVLR